jgi:hypothetical protein
MQALISHERLIIINKNEEGIQGSTRTRGKWTEKKRKRKEKERKKRSAVEPPHAPCTVMGLLRLRGT